MKRQRRIFTWFMDRVIRKLEEEKHYAAAHVHRSCLRSFLAFSGNRKIYLNTLTPAVLKEFEEYLSQHGRKWNTVSTYLRAIRSTYHRAVACGYIHYTPLLFKEVYTGIDTKKKRALSAFNLKQWLVADTHLLPSELQKAHAQFSLLFYLRGMPYIDLLHLRKTDLQDGVISYHRHKTGKQLRITVPAEADRLIRLYSDKADSLYLFPFPVPVEEKAEEDDESEDDEETLKVKAEKARYRAYQAALRKFNYQLARIGVLLGIKKEVSSYTARHSWATTAYHRNVSTGIIGGALGHSTIKATESYLKAFEDKKIDDANDEIISYVMHCDECVD